MDTTAEQTYVVKFSFARFFFFQTNMNKQAGAELCQAQFKLERTKPALPFKSSVAFPVLKSEVVVN